MIAIAPFLNYDILMKVELLAPARDKICAKAAIDCGADAIYIGASNFGARKNVPNSLEDIEEIVQYAHKFNVKVYITINTILTDEEIEQAKELVQKLYDIGADAIIIQDMGLIEAKTQRGQDAESSQCEERALEKGVRGVHFHASTQCDNRTPEKVKFLEEVGFSRVILARELSIEQIREIRKHTTVELEAFIHGALCVSYSGQCYLSQALGGRSANKGECAQPCRKKYSLVDEEGEFIAKEKHLLSLKDFNASKHIKALAQAGVTSFKIEGRLKDESYVKNVVGYYRKLIDELGLEKTSSGSVMFDFEPNLDKSFNREFTDYFLDGRKECFSFDSPKSKGEYIGKVSKIGMNYFELSVKDKRDEIHAQDGLCFYSGDKLSGCLVNKVDEVEAFRSGTLAKVQKIFLYKMEGIKVGTQIYRNADSQFEKQLKNSKTVRKIAVDIEFALGKIKATDEDCNYAEIPYVFEEMAQNEDKMADNIINQLKKSGESDFMAEKINITTEKIPFLPVSKLNELRRELFEKLAEQRRQEGKKARGQELKVNYSTIQPYELSTMDYKANVLNKYAKVFYEKHGCKITEMALESGKVSSNNKVVMTTKHCLKYAFNMCNLNNAKQASQAPKKLFLIDEKGKRYGLKFNCEKCEMEIVF